MKQIVITFLILIVTAINLNSQVNHYSKYDNRENLVKFGNETFIIRNNCYMDENCDYLMANITIDNIKNKYYRLWPYNTRTGIKYEPEVGNLVIDANEEEIYKKVFCPVFTSAELKRYKQSTDFMDMDIYLEPKSGKILEVTFDLDYRHDKILLEIPPEKIARLDRLFKSEIVYDVPYYQKDPNFLRSPFLVDFNKCLEVFNRLEEKKAQYEGPYYIDRDECLSCGACAGQCPVGAIYERDGYYVIDPEKCIGCGACLGVCPVEAIKEK